MAGLRNGLAALAAMYDSLGWLVAAMAWFSHDGHEELCRATEVIWVRLDQAAEQLAVLERRCESLEERCGSSSRYVRTYAFCFC